MLATLAREPAGYPFGSLVAYALDERGRPLFFLSALAEHTANLAADPRAALLVCAAPSAGGGTGPTVEVAEANSADPAAQAGQADPLALGRVTLVGEVTQVPERERAAALARFLARHPAAAWYAQLPDFAMYRLEVHSARYVGGFGRMSWIKW